MHIRVQNGMSLVATFPLIGWCQAREFAAKIARFVPNPKGNHIFTSSMVTISAI